MLPKVVWAIPSKGTFNLHASLLPDFRGAAPIHRAIMAGCEETGLTTFFIDDHMDTGVIIEQVRMEIGPDENVGQLHDRMKIEGASLIRSTLEKIAEGKVKTKEQHTLLKGMERLAPKLFKENCRIDWEKGVAEVHNFVRGLSPFPGAWTNLEFRDKKVNMGFKILSGKKTNLPVEQPGKLTIREKSILVPCSDFYFEVTELQPEGKRRMLSKEFLAGNALEACYLFE
jgi:methionyl-tRNA formyltransferase